jgi:hypothetical protein
VQRVVEVEQPNRIAGGISCRVAQQMPARTVDGSLSGRKTACAIPAATLGGLTDKHAWIVN